MSSTPRKPTPNEETQWEALADSVRELAPAAEGEDFEAALAEFKQLAGNVDPQEFLNTMHVPGDAGEHAPAIEAVLARIPDGWGRWISCDRGWYPIIVALDAQLRKIDPGYGISQIKEKYGDFRYSVSLNTLVVDEDDVEPPVPETIDWESEESRKWREKSQAWQERQDAYRATPEGSRRVAAAEKRKQLFYELVRAAEAEAAITCELCGQPGELRCTLSQSPWYKTLCPACARKDHYIKASDYDATWARVEPYHKQRARDSWALRQQGKKFVVVSADTSKELVVDAVYVRDPEAAAAVVTGSWDAVFIDDDAVGQAYLDALQEHYREHVRENESAREAAWAEHGTNNYPKKKPEGCPWLYHSHRVDVPRMFMQDLGATCWISQPQFFKPAKDEDPVGSEAELEAILEEIYAR